VENPFNVSLLAASVAAPATVTVDGYNVADFVTDSVADACTVVVVVADADADALRLDVALAHVSKFSLRSTIRSGFLPEGARSHARFLPSMMTQTCTAARPV
jgi:hypothetical protein